MLCAGGGCTVKRMLPSKPSELCGTPFCLSFLIINFFMSSLKKINFCRIRAKFPSTVSFWSLGAACKVVRPEPRLTGMGVTCCVVITGNFFLASGMRSHVTASQSPPHFLISVRGPCRGQGCLHAYSSRGVAVPQRWVCTHRGQPFPLANRLAKFPQVAKSYQKPLIWDILLFNLLAVCPLSYCIFTDLSLQIRQRKLK